MYITVIPKERPDTTVLFNLENVIRVDLVGETAGISLKGHAGQIRITMDDFNRLKMHFKAQNLSDMPAPVRHKES
jgi:hypothetical protein